MARDLLLGIHVSTVFISAILFTLRAYARLFERHWRGLRFFKLVPHINDSILLLSAIALSLSIGQYPLVDNWLTVKVAFLLCYIGLGLLFMHWAQTRAQEMLLYMLAMSCFIFIVSVAISHNPYGLLGLLSI